MDNWGYSNAALEVKGAFYNKEITVYVEGDDDPLFWDKVLKQVDINAYIEEVGGCEELCKYIDKIMVENADFYVATDRDHKDFYINDYITSDKILFTYGYSIENSMYKSNSINQIIIKYAKKPDLDHVSEIDNIIENFQQKVEDLILLDIASKKFNKSIKVFGDSCHRFLKNKNSIEICDKKIADFVDTIKDKFTELELKSINEDIAKIGKSNWYLIKGHFISLLIINIIKRLVKRHRAKDIAISFDDLFAHSIDYFMNNLNDDDIIHLITETEKINMH